MKTTAADSWTVVQVWHGPIHLFAFGYPTGWSEKLAVAVAGGLSTSGVALTTVNHQVTIEVIAENVSDAESTSMIHDLVANALRYHNRGAEPPMDATHGSYLLDLTGAETEGWKRRATARISEDGDVELAS
jgi:hypothetical protein